MTYKQIEAMRETRLWLSQIIVPTCATVVIVMTIPEVREAIAARVRMRKQQIENKVLEFKKK